MRTGALKALREACLQEAGNDNRKANKLIAEKFKRLITEKKIVPKDVSFKALFEGLVDLTDVDINNAKEVAEAVSSSAFTNITTLITHAITIEPYEQRANEVLVLVTQGDATMTDEETVRGMTAIGGVRRRLETEAYDETDFGEKRVAIRKSDFGRIIALTMEDIFNDKTGDIQARANTIGEDAGQHQEAMIIETLECVPRTSFQEVLSRAFVYNGIAFAQSDFYKTDHSAVVGLDGQINANQTSGGITEAGFTNAYNLFAAMVDERGKRIVVSPSQVVVHQQNELTLATLLATDRSVGQNFASTTGGINDVNQFGPRGKVKLATVTSPFMSTTPKAYMGQFPRSLLWLWVQRPQTLTMGATDKDAFERQIVWKARFNYYGGIGHRDYRYCVRITA